MIKGFCMRSNATLLLVEALETRDNPSVVSFDAVTSAVVYTALVTAK